MCSRFIHCFGRIGATLMQASTTRINNNNLSLPTPLLLLLLHDSGSLLRYPRTGKAIYARDHRLSSALRQLITLKVTFNYLRRLIRSNPRPLIFNRFHRIIPARLWAFHRVYVFNPRLSAHWVKLNKRSPVAHNLSNWWHKATPLTSRFLPKICARPTFLCTAGINNETQTWK